MSAPKEQGETPGRRNRSRREQPDTSERPGASVNMEELRELVTLMRENGVAELELEREEFRVRLRRESTAAEPAQVAVTPTSVPVANPAPAAPAPAPSGPSHPGTQATT